MLRRGLGGPTLLPRPISAARECYHSKLRTSCFLPWRPLFRSSYARSASLGGVDPSALPGIPFPVVVLRHGITTGHPWTVQSPSLSSDVGLGNTALGGNGTLYVVDSDNLTDTGLVWSYNGSQWANITSSNPSRRYGSLAVSKNKTLIAG